MRRMTQVAALWVACGLAAAGAADAQVGPVGIAAQADAGRYADPPPGALVTVPQAPEQLVAAGGRVVFTGGFTHVGPYTGAAAMLRSDSQVRVPAAAIKGQISDALALGDGFLVAGDFVEVGALPRRNLARLTAAGEAEATFAPDVPGFVGALAAAGGRVYAGGKTAPTAGGAAPSGSLVAVDPRTGARDPGFTPAPLPVVRELAAGDGLVFAGTDAPGTSLVALDGATGAQLEGFRPAVAGQVGALLLTEAGLWVGGRLGADPATGAQRCLVLLDPRTGAARTAPLLCDGSDARIDALIGAPGGRVVAGGTFGSIGDAASAGVAAIRPDGSADPAFRAAVRTPVYDLAAAGDRLIVGGPFTRDRPLNELVTLSAATGRPVDGVPPTRVDGPVNAIAAGSGRILAGGELRTVNPVARNGIAAIDGRSGALDPTFRPPPGLQELTDLEISGSRIYAVGSLRFRGRPRNLVALDARTGATLRGFVGARQLRGGYAFQAPTVLGPRLFRLGDRRIQVLDARTGRELRVLPLRLRGTTEALAAAAGSLYVGGSFRRTRDGRPANLAVVRLDPADGRVRAAFDPHADGQVYGLTASGDSLYLSGSFAHVGHVRRPGLAAVGLRTGALRTAFAPTVGGAVTQAGGRYVAVRRDGLLVLDRRTGRAVPGLVPRDETAAFAPTVGGLAVGATTNGLLGNDDGRYTVPFVGVIRPRARPRAVRATPRQAATPVPVDDAGLPRVVAAPAGLLTDGPVQGVARAGARIVALGEFTRAGARTGPLLVADPGGGPAVAASPTLQGEVRVAIPDGAGGAYVGGRFADGRGVVRIGADGRIASAFAVRTDRSVTALALDGRRLVLGGSFTTVGPARTPRRGVARVDAQTGTLDAAFRADRAQVVTALALQGDRLYVATEGELVAVARENGLLIPRFRPGVTGVVRGLLARGDRLLASGGLARRASGEPTAVAALDLEDGRLVDGFAATTASGPDPADVAIRGLAAVGDRIALAGRFTRLGDVPTRGVALLDPVTGRPDPSWSSTGSPDVRAVAASPDGTTVYLAAPEALGGVGRLPAAGGGSPQRVGPYLDDRAGALVGLERGLLVGGAFTVAGARALPGLVVADARTGQPSPGFRPARTAVGRVAATPSRVLLAGRLRTAAGRSAPGLLVALDARTGAVRAGFRPRAGFWPERLVTVGERVFAMADGRLLRVDDRGRARRVPGLRGYVMDLKVWRGRLLVAGSFTAPGGRTGLLALDPVTLRRVGAFRVAADGEVSSIAPLGDRVYALGLFGRVGAARRPGLAVLRAGSGGLLRGFAPRRRPDQLATLVAAPDRLLVAGRLLGADGRPLGRDAAARVRRSGADPDAVLSEGAGVLLATPVAGNRRELRLLGP